MLDCCFSVPVGLVAGPVVDPVAVVAAVVEVDPEAELAVDPGAGSAALEVDPPD